MMRSQSRKTLYLIASGLILAGFVMGKGKASAGLNLSKFSPAQQQKLLQVIAALQKAGLYGKQLFFAIIQVLTETGGFTAKSQVFEANNNASGIKFINKPYQKNAVPGTLVPASERVPGAAYNNYAKFATLNDWAADFIRILSRGARPIDANDIQEYNGRLAQNNYYDARTSQARTNYLKNLIFWQNKFI